MLPSLGFNEIVILGVLALLVVGPKDLPLLFRKIGRWTAKLRGMAQEFRSGFDELARQAELDELKREVEKLRQTSGLQDIGHELSKPLPTLDSYASAPTPTNALPAPDAPETAAEPATDTLPFPDLEPPQPEPALAEAAPSHAHDEPTPRSAP